MAYRRMRLGMLSVLHQPCCLGAYSYSTKRVPTPPSAAATAKAVPTSNTKKPPGPKGGSGKLPSKSSPVLPSKFTKVYQYAWQQKVASWQSEANLTMESFQVPVAAHLGPWACVVGLGMLAACGVKQVFWGWDILLDLILILGGSKGYLYGLNCTNYVAHLVLINPKDAPSEWQFGLINLPKVPFRPHVRTFTLDHVYDVFYKKDEVVLLLLPPSLKAKSLMQRLFSVSTNRMFVGTGGRSDSGGDVGSGQGATKEQQQQQKRKDDLRALLLSQHATHHRLDFPNVRSNPEEVYDWKQRVAAAVGWVQVVVLLVLLAAAALVRGCGESQVTEWVEELTQRWWGRGGDQVNPEKKDNKGQQ